MSEGLSLKSTVNKNLSHKLRQDRIADYDEDSDDKTFPDFRSTYRFLENALDGNGFENWVMETLSLSGQDRTGPKETGVEKGRIKLENPFICKPEWRSYDLVLDTDSLGATERLRQNYRNYQNLDEEDDDFSEGWNTREIGDLFKVLSIGLPGEKAERSIVKTDSYKYEFQLNERDFKAVHKFLESEIFPSLDTVEEKIGYNLEEVNVDTYMENFPHAHTDHVEDQLDAETHEVKKMRKNYFTSLQSFPNYQ